MTAASLPLARRDAADWHVFDYLMIALAFVVMASSVHWKVEGPAIIIAFVGFCVAYALFNYVHRGIVLRNAVLVLWTTVGIAHVLLSYLGWLPGHPAFHLQAYVFRMGYFTFVVLPVTSAFYAMFVVVQRNRAMPVLAWLGVAAGVGAAVSYYLYPPVDGYWLVEGEALTMPGVALDVLNYSIDNIAIVFWWSLFTLARNSWRAMVPLVAVLLLSDSAQMNLLALLAMAIWAVRNPLRWSRPIAALIIFGCPLAAIFLVLFAGNMGIDPNTIHRARWWVEALMAVAKNGGIALGFGSDSTHDYALDERFQMLGKWGQLPIHVIHNDFCYAFYSTGLIGGALLLLLHFKYYSPQWAPDRGTARVGVIVFLMACLTTSVNSAMVSPTILIGLCWAYAYGSALNSRR
jgi:hypothetical protein